ncbi:MAG: hypothetical protein NTX57_11995 [Armatimonadetes bacterium]|nr:hypothetical protein [Armatimonadota bacterium]
MNEPNWFGRLVLKNLLQVATVCGLSLLTLSGSAHAQTRNRYDVNSSSIKLGFFTPGSGVGRQAGGSQILNFEAETVVQYIPERNENSVFSIGYIERDNFRIIPVMLSQITHDNKRTSGYDYYYGYGLGVFSTRLNSGGVTTTSGSTKNLIGAQAVMGLNLTESTFLEFKYLYPAKYDNQFVGGLQVMFGMRM